MSEVPQWVGERVGLGILFCKALRPSLKLTPHWEQGLRLSERKKSCPPCKLSYLIVPIKQIRGKKTKESVHIPKMKNNWTFHANNNFFRIKCKLSQQPFIMDFSISVGYHNTMCWRLVLKKTWAFWAIATSVPAQWPQRAESWWTAGSSGKSLDIVNRSLDINSAFTVVLIKRLGYSGLWFPFLKKIR